MFQSTTIIKFVQCATKPEQAELTQSGEDKANKWP